MDVYLKWFLFFIKRFLIFFIIIWFISTNIVIYTIGLDKFKLVFFDGLLRDLLILSAPCFILSIFLTSKEYKGRKNKFFGN